MEAVASPFWQASLTRYFWTDMYTDGGALISYLQAEYERTKATLDALGVLAV